MTDRSDAVLDDRGLPRDVAAQFRVSLGLDLTPATLAEWVEATARTLDDEYIPDEPDALCRTESSRHEARFDGETRYFRCFFDMLLLPFVLDEPVEVRVSTRSPISGNVVSGRVAREGVSITPEEAVMSFGAATDVVSADYLDVPASLAYRRFCPYIDAFPDETEYEQWADETDGGVTMPLTLPEGFEIARRLVGGDVR